MADLTFSDNVMEEYFRNMDMAELYYRKAQNILKKSIIKQRAKESL